MPIVFVHGLFPAIYDPPPGWLCPDLPGYGARAAQDASLPAAVDLIRYLCVEPAHIVGHSIGGAIAVLLAAQYPSCVASVINVEGNFTLKDAFWSLRLVEMNDAEAAQSYTDPVAWLTGAGVPVTPTGLAIAQRSLATPVRTIQSMARSVVEITSRPQYLDQVREVLDRGTPVHLIAGEHSLAGWDVPDFVRARAASFRVQPAAGHMLMMNGQRAFAELVEAAIS